MISAQVPQGRRLSAEARRMMPWCVALSAAVHVLLLAGMAPSPHQSRAAGRADHAGGQPARTVSVRLIQPAPAPFVAAAASAAGAMPSAPASAASTAASAAMEAEALPPPESLSSARGTGTEIASASASEAAGEPGEGAEASEGGYVPRPLLSVAPKPVIPVVIAAPPAMAAGRLMGRYSGVLALYVDELGRVRRVETEPPALPEPMERAAREAFLGARFSPGQMGGHAVKSRIRVEVVFDDGPLPAASAASGASSGSASTSASASAGAGAGAGASAPAGAQRSP
jgi:hypothetical protein